MTAMKTRAPLGLLVLAWIFSTTIAHANNEATAPAARATTNFLERKHRWSATAQLAAVHSDVKHPEENAMKVDTLALVRPARAGQLTVARFDHQTVPLWLESAMLAHNRIFRQRFATAFALANPGMHTGKLSELAVDPYAVLCLDENAAAIADIDYAHLAKTPHTHRESLLVAAANAPNHRAALTEMLDRVIKESLGPPNAKFDMHAHAVSVTTALIEWIAVLPDADLDLVKTKLKPRLPTLGATPQFVKELDEILPLLTSK